MSSPIFPWNWFGGGSSSSQPAVVVPQTPQPVARVPSPTQASKSESVTQREALTKLRKKRTLATSQRLTDEPMTKQFKLGTSNPNY